MDLWPRSVDLWPVGRFVASIGGFVASVGRFVASVGRFVASVGYRWDDLVFGLRRVLESSCMEPNRNRIAVLITIKKVKKKGNQNVILSYLHHSSINNRNSIHRVCHVS